MAQPLREADPQFSQPVRQITTMILVLALVGAGAYLAFPSVSAVFLANPWLNGFIGLVFVIGVVACFWQVFQLIGSVNWIEGHAAGRAGHEITRPPRLLAPLAALLRSRGRAMQISSTSARSILDSVATRIDEARDITRYLSNLLIFLGLLGTFYGLATTVPALVETIRSLSPEEGEEGVEVFGRLMGGLEAQLGGMGVAFSSSLLGLAGSLVVGLLELFAGHGQNRFYRELEEWLSTITRLSYAPEGEAAPTGDAGVLAAVLERMADRIDRMGDYGGSPEADERVERLADAVERLATRLEEERAGAALYRLAEGQERIVELMEKEAAEGGHAVDAESRMRLRSMDVQLLRILEEISAGRQEATADLRGDLAALLKAVRMLGREPAPPVPSPAAQRRG